jgi:hypothetical protein
MYFEVFYVLRYLLLIFQNNRKALTSDSFSENSHNYWTVMEGKENWIWVSFLFLHFGDYFLRWKKEQKKKILWCGKAIQFDSFKRHYCDPHFNYKNTFSSSQGISELSLSDDLQDDGRHTQYFTKGKLWTDGGRGPPPAPQLLIISADTLTHTVSVHSTAHPCACKQH